MLVYHVVISLLVRFDLIIIIEKDYVLSSIFRISNKCNDIEINLRGSLHLYLFRGLFHESEQVVSLFFKKGVL